MKVLIIAPHPDDEVIGCGGAAICHVRAGAKVAAVFLTSGELGLKQLPAAKARLVREQEARKASKILGLSEVVFLRGRDWFLGEEVTALAKLLRPVLRRWNPGIIYVPHPSEWHPDHQVALKIVRLALRGAVGTKPKLRAYEVWTPLPAHDHVVDITPVMPTKLRALRAHRSQLAGFRYDRAVQGLNAFRGELAARCRFAEVFQTLT